MNNSITPEQRKQRIEFGLKILGLGIAAFFVAPIVFVAIKGLIGAVIAIAIAGGVVMFTPVIARMAANWRLKALKAEATRSPVETLQNEFIKKEDALKSFKNQITDFAAEVLNFADQVTQYVKDGIEDAQVYVKQLDKMKQLLTLRQNKFNQAQDVLAEFAETIQRTDRKWKMACAAAKMNEAAGEMEGDVFSKICIETAMDAVQTKLNKQFAELEMSIVEEGRENFKGLLKKGAPLSQTPVLNVANEGVQEFGEVEVATKTAGFVSRS